MFFEYYCDHDSNTDNVLGYCKKAEMSYCKRSCWLSSVTAQKLLAEVAWKHLQISHQKDTVEQV